LATPTFGIFDHIEDIPGTPTHRLFKDRLELITLADVRAVFLSEPEYIQSRNSWQRLIELLMKAAGSEDDIEAATRKVEDALFLEARYVRP